MVEQIVVLTWIQTFAAAFALIGVFVAVYTLRQSLNQSIIGSMGPIIFDKGSMGCFVVKTPGFLGLLIGKKVEPPQLPTVDYLIRAGDHQVYTSAMFDQAPPSSTTVCWVNLYTQFFNQIALQQELNHKTIFGEIDMRVSRIKCVADILSRARSNVRQLKEKLAHIEATNPQSRRKSSTLPTQIRKSSTFGTQIRESSTSGTQIRKPSTFGTQTRDVENPEPEEELSQDLDPERDHMFARIERESFYEHKMVKCILDLDGSETCLPKDVPGQWLSRVDDFQRLRILDQRPCIEISREELAGLALALGMRLAMKDRHTIDGIGPFGICLSGRRADMNWRLHISHKRRYGDRATRGSGYSILFAKHIACGSLPFKQSAGLIHCVCVDRSVLNTVKRGKYINVYDRDRHPSSLNYLIHLPAACQLRIYGASREMRNISENQNPQGSIFDSTSDPVSTWPKVVARIAFGGLVPQANTTLVDAVQFTVGSRVNPCSKDCKEGDPCIKLVNALTTLRSKINQRSKGLKLFGALGREEIPEDSTVSETNCLEVSTCRETGALFARYMTLLERMTAMSKSTLADVYGKCCRIIEMAYERAVVKQKEVDESAVHGECDGGRLADEFELTNDVENVQKKVDSDSITAEDCAKVARCIIAAWTWRVRQIHDLQWREGEGEHVPPSDERTALDKRAVAMVDLPSISALGFC